MERDIHIVNLAAERDALCAKVQGLEGRLEDTVHKLSQSEMELALAQEEIDGLRSDLLQAQTLNHGIDGRVTALSMALSSMMDGQESIEASINEKDDYLVRTTKRRLKGLDELMDFETYNSGSENGNQTLELQDALESQNNEMSQIMDILEAMKDSENVVLDANIVHVEGEGVEVWHIYAE